MNMTTVPSNQLKAMQHEIADLKEQVAQQAEAIRLKDAALEHVIGMNLSMVTTKLCTAAITIQPSPEILQDRDERVAANQAGGHNVAANTNSASTSASDLPNTAAIVAISGKPRSNSSRSV